MSYFVTFSQDTAAGTICEIPITPMETLFLTWCPAGSFRMGSASDDPFAQPLEKPQHQREVQGFWMSIFPITQAQWLPIMSKETAIISDDHKVPVEGMRWVDAVSFCEGLTTKLQESGSIEQKHRFMLPTEVEWEYACRAGSDTRWFFGSHPEALVDYAWFSENSDKTIHPVGQKRANAWGLYDLYGNVEEWCLDGFVAYRENLASQATLVPTPNARITRGGSYQSSGKVCSSSSRTIMEINNPYNEPVGFRVVLKAEN